MEVKDIMENKLLLTILFSLMICHAGCMTTTQKGAAYGTAGGAALGAGIGDHIDKKREQAEKAQMYRQLEMEGEMPVRSGYQQEPVAQRSEDLFTREWENDHWVYTPTNNPNESNLFRRVKGENGRWDFIPVKINKLDSGMAVVKPQQYISENEGIEEARKELEKELEAIRKEDKQ